MKLLRILKNPQVLSAVLLLTVFLIDIFIPLGVAVGVLYVCCIALLIREESKVILSFSIITTALIIIIYFSTLSSETSWMAGVNRGISILAIWVVYFIALRHKELDRKVQQHNIILERQNKELQQFIYIASHDLQEPLRRVNNFTTLISNKYADKFDETGEKSIQYITEATTRMHELITGLRDYGRIGTKKKWAKVDCNKLLEDLKEDFSDLISETDTTISYAELPTIVGNETELRILFYHLIQNAIKFRKADTPPKIDISAKFEGGWTFMVKDNGIGIDSKYEEKVFSIFKRLHNNGEFDGIGIGLAFSKKIIELHGGQIWFESTPNKGSTFYFNIPAKS